MLKIVESLNNIREQITNAEKKYNRAPGSVKLVAITKKQPMGKLKTVADEGLKDFGEAHLQEALAKLSRLKQYPIEWHFLDPIQPNKTQAIAQYFDWVHSVERAKEALKLSEFRPENLAPINILIEVNVNDEDNKIGVAFEELAMIAEFIANLPRVKLRGLTANPTASHQIEDQRKPFKRLKEAFESLKQNAHPDLDTLCMGKSHDFEAAIAEGATMVRIGTAIFGDTGI